MRYSMLFRLILYQQSDYPALAINHMTHSQPTLSDTYKEPFPKDYAVEMKQQQNNKNNKTAKEQNNKGGTMRNNAHLHILDILVPCSAAEAFNHILPKASRTTVVHCK